MSERLTRQMIQSREKKKRIYDTAMEMFMEYGYEQTTIRDICKKAGITNSTFYNFFGDKLSILLQYNYELLSSSDDYLSLKQEYLENPYQAICDFFVSSTIQLERCSRDLAREIILNTHRMLGAQYNSMPNNTTKLRLTNFLKSACDQGFLPEDTQCREIAEYLVMGMNGFCFNWLVLDEEQDFLPLAQRMMPMIFKAVTDQPILVRVP